LKLELEISNVYLGDEPTKVRKRLPVKITLIAIEAGGNSHEFLLCLPRYVANKIIDVLSGQVTEQ